MNFSVLPYQPHKAQQFSTSDTTVTDNATTVTIICSGASKQPGQPPAAHTKWNCVHSCPHAYIFLFHKANGALMGFTWLPPSSSSVEIFLLFCIVQSSAETAMLLMWKPSYFHGILSLTVFLKVEHCHDFTRLQLQETCTGVSKLQHTCDPGWL